MHPLGKVSREWSPEFAYAIGLIATDGCLCAGRKINLTSRDREQIENFKKCLGLRNKIGSKLNGKKTSRSFVIQFGDVAFYNFLLNLGITPRKSKIIGKLSIPRAFFFDFLRGHFDGDGSFYSYFDGRWKSSLMFYMEFVSASRKHIDWLRGEIFELVGIVGHVSGSERSTVYQLRYAKSESLKLLPKLYYNAEVICLSRKRDKIARVAKLADAPS